MLPNGGFPPITLCNESTSNESIKDKGFFFSTKTNNLNIRNILNKKQQPFIELSDTEDELKVVDSI